MEAWGGLEGVDEYPSPETPRQDMPCGRSLGLSNPWGPFQPRWLVVLCQLVGLRGHRLGEPGERPSLPLRALSQGTEGWALIPGQVS